MSILYAVCTKSFQLCLTLCDPMDYSLPVSSVHGIFQAMILGWVAMPSSRDLPNPEIKLKSPVSSALTGGFFATSATWEAQELPHDLAIPHLGVYPKDSEVGI